MINREPLFREAPPLLQEREGKGYPDAIHINTPVPPAETVVLSKMITIWMVAAGYNLSMANVNATLHKYADSSYVYSDCANLHAI